MIVTFLPTDLNLNLTPDDQSNQVNQSDTQYSFHDFSQNNDSFAIQHNEDLLGNSQFDYNQPFDNNVDCLQESTNSSAIPHTVSFHDAYDSMARDELIANQNCLGVPPAPSHYQSPTDSYQFEQAVQRDAHEMREQAQQQQSAEEDAKRERARIEAEEQARREDRIREEQQHIEQTKQQ